MAKNSPQALQAVQLQVMANSFAARQFQPIRQSSKFAPNGNHKENQTHVGRTIQRLIDVRLETDDDDKKSLEAVGSVKEFKNGTTAGKNGWLGVSKYRAYYQIDSAAGGYPADDVGPLKNDFTTPEAGHVLGQQNGGNGGDPENIFAQDGGSNNSTYKKFENKMRSDLNKCNNNDQVVFKAYLAGDDIERGAIADAALSEASDIESD